MNQHRSLSEYYERRFAQQRAAAAVPRALFIVDGAWIADQVGKCLMERYDDPEYGEVHRWVGPPDLEPHRSRLPHEPSDAWPAAERLPIDKLRTLDAHYEQGGPVTYVSRSVALRRHWAAHLAYGNWLVKTNTANRDLLEQFVRGADDSQERQDNPEPDPPAGDRSE